MDYGLGLFGAFFGVLIFFMVILLAIGIAFYVMMALGLSNMAKGRGMEDKAVLAWIPIANLYLIGLMVEEVNLFGFKLQRVEIAFPLIQVGTSFLAAIPVLGQILVITNIVVTIIILATLAEQYEPDKKYLYAIFAAIGFFIIGRKVKNGQYVNNARNSTKRAEETSSDDEDEVIW